MPERGHHHDGLFQAIRAAGRDEIGLNKKIPAFFLQRVGIFLLNS